MESEENYLAYDDQGRRETAATMSKPEQLAEFTRVAKEELGIEKFDSAGRTKLRNFQTAVRSQQLGVNFEIALAHVMPKKYEEGKRKQRFHEQQLLPWLKEQKMSFSEPSTQGIMYIDGVIPDNTPICFGIEDLSIDPPSFHTSLKDLSFSDVSLKVPELGFNPIKVVSSLEALKKEILSFVQKKTEPLNTRCQVRQHNTQRGPDC